METHLVEEAILAGDLGLVRSHIGVPSVVVDATVDARAVLDAQAGGHGRPRQPDPRVDVRPAACPPHHFADVYGWEWYVRTGPAGPIDALD